MRFLKRVLAVGFLLGLVGFVAFGWLFAVKLREAEEMMVNLPDILDGMGRQGTTIWTADGKLMYKVVPENRQPVKITDIPSIVEKATLAAEDKRFYDHHGVDYIALARAVATNAREGSSQGGSTITMQLVKRVYTSPRKTLDRKLQDIALAVTLERRKSKREILQLYLNQIYYGEGAFGIKVAADVYFGKKLEDLTISEAATLARCVRRPSDENPFKDLDRAVHNRNVVLAIMREEGMITEEQYQEARSEQLKLAPRRSTDRAQYFRAPYAVRHVIDQVRRDFPEIDLANEGYRIETTIDSEIQKQAEESLRAVVRANRGSGVGQGAFVMIDRDGQIVAEVGGMDFAKNQYNAVTQGRRQPGSSFKPFVYASALLNGAIRPNDYISNARFTWRDPVTGQEWSPANNNGKYGGSMSVRSAIANSVNVPAVRVMEKVGPQAVVSYAKSIFGFQSNLDPYLSLALGASAVSPLEMAQAYSVFMLKGDRATPYVISRIVGPDGKVLKSYSPRIVRNVLDRTTAHYMDEYLRAVVEAGTATKARNVIESARGKTGTTNDNRDAWFCGYTNEFLGVGWIAHENYKPMGRRVYGGTQTIDIWIGSMKKAQELVKSGKYSKYDAAQDAFAPEEEAEPPRRRVPDPEPEEQPLNIPPPAEEDSDPPGVVTIPMTENEPPPPVVVPASVPDPKPAREQPPTKKTEPPPRRAATPPPEPPTVTVEICADTGLRSNMYCPETVDRRFPKASAPTRRCRMHHP